MARVAIALVLLVASTGTARAEGEELPADTLAAAAAAHVDPVALQGAINSTGADPWAYLRGTGELAPLPSPTPALRGAVSRADCIIAKESGGLDVPNRQGSGATGPGQYFASTWARHVALYRAATGYGGALSLHSLADVRRVMAWILAAIPSSRSEWSVSGC